jgi:hypothetical protein
MKHTLLVIALSALSGAVFAQTEVRAPSVQAPIGRLFFTPAERAQLDLARAQRKPPSQAAAAAQPVEATPAAQVVTYGGIVRRSDGRSMLWINNRLVEEKDALKGLNLKGKVGADGAVTLQVPETGGSISVKVGQSVELQTGRVAEVRKPTPEAKSPTEEPKPAAAEPASTAAAAAKPATPESAEKKPAAGAGAGLKLDLGSNAGTSR